MLRSFEGQLDKVSSFLVKNGKADLLLPERVNEDFLEHLIAFFQAFERAVKLVEGDEKPTLQYVLPAYERLLRHCRDNLDDPVVGTLAAKFYELIPVSVLPIPSLSSLSVDVVPTYSVFVNSQTQLLRVPFFLEKICKFGVVARWH
jgi:hypothetical protein